MWRTWKHVRAMQSHARRQLHVERRLPLRQWAGVLGGTTLHRRRLRLRFELLLGLLRQQLVSIVDDVDVRSGGRKLHLLHRDQRPLHRRAMRLRQRRTVRGRSALLERRVHLRSDLVPIGMLRQ
jgi:hypothetical protein